MKRLVPATFALAVAASQVALACPYCAGRDAVSNSKVLWALGPMILFPFAVALVSWRVIRRLSKADA